MKTMTIVEWQNLGEKLYGNNVEDWEFKCPMCGKVSKVSDFQKYESKGATPSSAYQECIGRYEGKGTPKNQDGKCCNWTAYGFFGIPNDNKVVLKDDDGKTFTTIFPFSKEE